jgi:hypothetical protein
MKQSILLILWMAVVFSAAGQSRGKSAMFFGHVVDSKGIPVEYATIILLQDSVQKAGAVADSSGGFRMEAQAGSYDLVAQCVGYEPLHKKVSLPLSESATLVLATSSLALNEVVVQARSIERKADRFVMSVQPASGKNGTELLAQAPGVWLTGSSVSINGASGTKVFVDNREIKLSGEELVNYLRSLRSEDIRRVEVVPVAGSEYDANAQGGVILISLRRRPDNGMQGSISMGTSLGKSFARYLPSASINARVGRWNLNAAVSGTFTPNDKSKMIFVRDYKEKAYSFQSNTRLNDDTRYGTGRFGAIFEIDTLNSIGGEVEYIRQSTNEHSSSNADFKKGEYPLASTGIYGRNDQYHTITATVNYLHKIDAQGSLFKVIADYAGKKSTGNNDYHDTWKSDIFSKDSTYRSHSDATYNIFTTDVSYLKYFRKSFSATWGAKYTHTYMNDCSQYEGLTNSAVWQLNPSYGYSLKYHENIAAAYASLSTEVNQWSFIAGLRTEYTRTNDRSDGITRDYFDFFPNMNITYSFDRMKKWMLIGQYSRNIERPAFYTLNPNRIQTSTYGYVIGNPYLKPTYIHRFGTTLVYYYRFTFSVGGNLHHNLIRENTRQDVTNPDISYVIYQNHDIENHWYAAVNMPLQITPRLNLTANLVGVKQDIRVTSDAKFKSHYLGFANVIATLRLPKDYSLEAQYSGTSRLYSGNSEIDPHHTLDLSLRKKLLDSRLLLVASVANVFNRYNSYVSRLDEYDSFGAYRKPSEGRLFKVSLTWNFNSGKKIKKSRVEIDSASERNRLEEK